MITDAPPNREGTVFRIQSTRTETRVCVSVSGVFVARVFLSDVYRGFAARPASLGSIGQVWKDEEVIPGFQHWRSRAVPDVNVTLEYQGAPASARLCVGVEDGEQYRPILVVDVDVELGCVRETCLTPFFEGDGHQSVWIVRQHGL